MNFARKALPPKTLTEHEQALVLEVTGARVKGFRDHLLIALALGTGLRESELVALNVGDMVNGGNNPKRRIVLRVFKRCTDQGMPQEVFLPDNLLHKVGRFLKWKADHGESVELDAPLFVSRHSKRLSTRRVRSAFATWQRRAGLDKIYNFHALRHTACTNLYRKTRDIRVVQRFARHTNITTTTIYASPSDEDLLRAVRDLNC